MGDQFQVKNRAAAAVQVTAEQLVRAAREHQAEDEERLGRLQSSTRITDPEELRMEQAEKRKEFENKLRRTNVNSASFVRYARWEESQLEFRRARSVYERALEAGAREVLLWQKYADFEARNKFVNHARNVLDRAVQQLPRQNALWYKYVHLEESLGRVENARRVFERWMRWRPEEQAWAAYVNFEVRHGQPAKARDVLERLCGTFPRARHYIKFARWEETHGQLALAREVFSRALEELDRTESMRQELFVAFARFEERCKETERARAIYRQALDLLPKNESRELYSAYVSFERQHGDRDTIETVLLTKRRTQLEAELARTPEDPDLWLDYTRLEEAHAEAEAHAAKRSLDAADAAYAAKVVSEARERVRAVYERAVAHAPADRSHKAPWRRYVYLWINWAVFEELQAHDVEAARRVYRRCLGVIPHAKFTFSKLWIMAAHFEVRQMQLGAARKLLGQAIGRCPREKVFKAYIQLELQLGNVDRCRTLYGKYLELAPQDCHVWQKYAELEHAVGETERARALFELAVGQPVLDMPETLWKRYIDFEVGLRSKAGRANARRLYRRLLERTRHAKVWVSLARFEAEVCKDPAAARSVFAEAYAAAKAAQRGDTDVEGKESRAVLLAAWLALEERLPDNEAQVEAVRAKQPRKVKKMRQLADGGGMEEYYDYLFPDDPKKGLKLLQIAQKWKESAKADSNEIDLDDI